MSRTLILKRASAPDLRTDRQKGHYYFLVYLVIYGIHFHDVSKTLFIYIIYHKDLRPQTFPGKKWLGLRDGIAKGANAPTTPSPFKQECAIACIEFFELQTKCHENHYLPW